MKCPTCKSDLASGVKYCPVCGTDVESALAREQQAARAAAPTQAYQPTPSPQQAYAYDDATAVAQPVSGQQAAYQQQPYQQQTYQRPSQQPGRMAGAAQGAVPGRGFDTAKMGSSPKWPIVLIVALVVIIVAVLLLIFHPWTLVAGSGDAGQQSGSATTAQTAATTTGTDTATATDAQPAVTDGSDAAAGTTAATTLDDASAYAQLTASYDQLDGFHTQISAIAADFSNTYGSGDLTDVRSRAADLQAQIAAAADALNALDIAADSTYAATKAAIANLYSDLAMRISVLVEACDANMSGQDAGAILSRDNGEADEHGHTNRYLIDYEQNYDAARPVQQ